MKPRFDSRPWIGGPWRMSVALAIFLLSSKLAPAQPSIISVVPANAATGVSTNAPVVFTFSESMDTNSSEAVFLDSSGEISPTEVWSVNNTVLTCTPAPAFPADTLITWVVSGQDTNGNSLSDTPLPVGNFTTTGGSSSGGSGSTNQYTTFGVGGGIYYDQLTADVTTVETNIPGYVFLTSVTLSSNQTAQSATVELPSTAVSNMNQNPFSPSQFTLAEESTNQTELDATFGNGNYIFTLVNGSSNRQVTVALSSALAQPAAPQVSNFTAAQTVDATKPFTLSWEPFSAGSSGDLIEVTVGSVFGTGQIGTSNALSASTTSVTIPANTMQPGNTYDSFLVFYHYNVSSNVAAKYVTAAYRFSATLFNIVATNGTVASSGSPVILTNEVWNGQALNFDVMSPIGDVLVVQYSTNLVGPWHNFYSATNTTGLVPVADSVNSGRAQVFYRAFALP